MPTKNLPKTCATYYDKHVHKSSIEILGDSPEGIPYRHYAHRAPLAFRAIMTFGDHDEAVTIKIRRGGVIINVL